MADPKPLTPSGSLVDFAREAAETVDSIGDTVQDVDLWTPRFAQATNRTNKRKTVEVGVYRIPLAVQRRAMGIEWMRASRGSRRRFRPRTRFGSERRCERRFGMSRDGLRREDPGAGERWRRRRDGRTATIESVSSGRTSDGTEMTKYVRYRFATRWSRGLSVGEFLAQWERVS